MATSILAITSIPSGILSTNLTGGSSSGSISSIPGSISTSATSESSETTSLPPTTSNATSTSISTSSSLTSTTETSTTSSSNTPSPSTSPTFLPSTSTSISSTVISNSSTTVDDHSNTSTSLLPTTFVNSPSNSNDLVSRRTAIIAGTTTGLIALVLIILGAIFAHRRHKLRKSLEISGKKKEGRSLLDGEEFDDDERNISGMPSYHHYPTHPFHPAVQSTPSLLRSRISETGSIFREEVWPPPGFVDPISKQSSQVDLSVIVDDVMGPPMSYKPRHNSSLSTSSSNSNYSGPSAGSYERRQPTDASAVSALSSTSTSPLFTDKLYSDPFRSTSRPSTPASSLPVGASTPVSAGVSSTVSYPTVSPTVSPSSSISSSARARSGSPNTQPQKSSPLARALTGDTQLWLTRNVHPNRTQPTAPP
ncbi:hypothetical protein BYT27DRAFT_7334010 [Phlegmacium glaucopus]|nr:hypothetical protein BYT27DRAFT_7334010 [Phlegmacium glaucopus]